MTALDAPRDPAGERWKLQAACLDKPADLFFPDKTGRPEDAKRKIAAAKAICATCDVVDECLAYARRNHEHYGVWGGLTPAERMPKRRPDRLGRRGVCYWCGTGFHYTGALYCSVNCRNKASRARVNAALAVVRAETAPRPPL